MARLGLSEYVFTSLFIVVIVAEVIKSFNQNLSLFLHLVTIFIATFYVIFTKKGFYILSLALPSILRLLNFSMPIFFSYTIYWFPLIYAPVFASVYVTVRALNLSTDDIGLKMDRFYIYLPIAVLIGYVLASIEYRILQPEPLIPEFTMSNILTLFIVMFVFVSLAEELIFRSVLQTSLENNFGMLKGLLLATVVFAVMHADKGPVEFVFVFSAGLLIGYIFQRTRSLFFITIIHGTINVLIFGLFQAYGKALI